MASLELNVVSILVGILIVRIIYVWFNSVKVYLESFVTIDVDEAEVDYLTFKREAIGALTVTGLCGFVIIVVISWYQGSTK